MRLFRFEEDKEEFRTAFRDLSDFVHENNLRHIVAVGPSAAPFARAIARAYKNRHGSPLKVIALGEPGEIASGNWGRYATGGSKFISREKEVEAARVSIAKRLPRESFLLFDEVVTSGETLNGLSNFLKTSGHMHKTATLRNASGVKTDFASRVPFYVAWLKRSQRLAKKPSYEPLASTPLKERATFLKKAYGELREIADSVERKA